jgi:hypothetical protein
MDALPPNGPCACDEGANKSAAVSIVAIVIF